jgi:two-component system, LuxR family, response regulator FixJ
MVAQLNEETEKGVVVIVEDDQAVCSALEFSLEVEGYTVKTFASGVDLLQQQDIPTRGCMVIDYYLPGMNGMEIIHALRERSVSLPMILITTQPPPALRKSAAAAGIPIIEKPLLGNTLIEGIRAAFGATELTQH